jgi:hypothetical protein
VFDPFRLGCNEAITCYINPIISPLCVTITKLAILEKKKNAKITGDSVMFLIIYICDATSPIPGPASTSCTGILYITFH